MKSLVCVLLGLCSSAVASHLRKRGEDLKLLITVYSVDGVAEGDILSLHFEAELEETEAARKRVAEIRKRLLKKE